MPPKNQIGKAMSWSMGGMYAKLREYSTHKVDHLTM